MLRLLDDRGGVMVMNGTARLLLGVGLCASDKSSTTTLRTGAPETRSWFRNAVSAKRPTLNENENGNMWRAQHVQLFTPIMLTRYGGNKQDPDPRYNHTVRCGGPSARERERCFSDLCLCFQDHLDYGTLSMTYGSLWHNTTRENVYAHMTPITAVEIGEGFVIGLERTVTKISGTVSTTPISGRERPFSNELALGRSTTHRPCLGWRKIQVVRSSNFFTPAKLLFDNCFPTGGLSGSEIHRYKDCLKTGVERAGLEVRLQVGPGEIAVIVWEKAGGERPRLPSEAP